MRISLEQLQQTKGQVTSFPFFTSLSEYIAKNYADIADQLEMNHVREILNEMKKEQSFLPNMNLFHLDTPDTFEQYYMDVNIKDQSSDVKTTSNLKLRTSGWNSIDLSFDEVLYVSDRAAYELYLEEKTQERKEKELKAQEKRLAKGREEEKKRIEVEANNIALRNKYGLDVTANVDRVKLYESLFVENNDPKEGMKAFNRFFNQVEEIVEDSAYDCNGGW